MYTIDHDCSQSGPLDCAIIVSSGLFVYLLVIPTGLLLHGVGFFQEASGRKLVGGSQKK